MSKSPGMDSARRTRRTSRGVTLLELTVAIAILGMMLGLSVMAFRNANRDLGVRAAANHCVALARSVEERARAFRAPGYLVLDLKENSIYTLSEETLQAWNFEDERGAFGQKVEGTRVTQAPGREGLAGRFSGTVSMRCEDVPAYLPGQGIGIEFWLWRGQATGRRTICSIGRDVEVWLGTKGDLQVKMGGLSLSSKDVRIPFEKWVYVHAFFNGFEGRLYANDRELDVRRGKMEWSGRPSLVLGSSKDGFVGLLDSFRLNLVIPRDKYYLPAEVKFAPRPGAGEQADERVIAFTPQGKLDPARHQGPVSFTVKSSAEQKTITISPQGGVTR